jgi:FkbH-like protein
MANLAFRASGLTNGQGDVTAASAERSREALAQAIERSREVLSMRLFEAVANSQKTATMLAQGGLEFVLQAEKRPLVDYLVLRFRTGDPLYEQLFVGEKLKQFHLEPLADDARRPFRARVAELERRAFRELIGAQVSGEDAAALDDVLDRMYRTVLAEGRRTARVLLVGDCLHLDIVTFAQPALAAERIVLEPTYATSKNPVQLQRDVGALDPARYDAVFFSPFTYEFVPSLEPFHRMGMAARTPWHAGSAAAAAFAQVAPTLRLLAERFECPVIVHNTAQVIRVDDSVRGGARRRLTWPGRRRLAAALNARVAQAVADLNRSTFEHLHVLDETSWLRAFGDAHLGRYLHAAEYQHPAVLGQLLAEAYVDIIYTITTLLEKKLVACDLDNTLWEGLIGEGPVRHYTERQRALAALRQKGVVLAINSKNDPRNVRFDGAVLDERDFVHREINWDSKAVNIRRISETLNLKTKDFVFVDDRPDERDLVTRGVPGVIAVDATSERTWRRMELWARLAPGSETDRTEMYRQYRARQEALAVHEEVDEQALLAGLGLVVQIREAEAADLKRVAELINRTNQFNLQGSRTTFGEVKQWFEDPATSILLASAADRFGSNGTVCIAVARRTPQAVEIPVFVLSCRVFGYGIEHAVMNHIKRAIRRNGEPLVARLVETAHNAPCHDFLPANGFLREADRFVCAGSDVGADPAWLTVERAVASDA